MKRLMSTPVSCLYEAFQLYAQRAHELCVLRVLDHRVRPITSQHPAQYRQQGISDRTSSQAVVGQRKSHACDSVDYRGRPSEQGGNGTEQHGLQRDVMHNIRSVAAVDTVKPESPAENIPRGRFAEDEIEIDAFKAERANPLSMIVHPGHEGYRPAGITRSLRDSDPMGKHISLLGHPQHQMASPVFLPGKFLQCHAGSRTSELRRRIPGVRRRTHPARTGPAAHRKRASPRHGSQTRNQANGIEISGNVTGTSEPMRGAAKIIPAGDRFIHGPSARFPDRKEETASPAQVYGHQDQRQKEPGRHTVTDSGHQRSDPPRRRDR